MESMGNTQSNEILECTLNSTLKPVPNSPREMKEKFIREKYEIQKFVKTKIVSRKIPIAQKPTMESLFKEGFLYEISLSQYDNSVKRRWCILKLSNTSAQLQMYRGKTVSAIRNRM